MTTFPISNWLLPAPKYKQTKLALPPGNRRPHEPFNLIELRRSLSRWENEGGTISENIPLPHSPGTHLEPDQNL